MGQLRRYGSEYELPANHSLTRPFGDVAIGSQQPHQLRPRMKVSRGDEVIWPPASGVSKGSSMHAQKARILMHFTVPMPSDPRRKTLGSQAWLPYG